MTTLKTAQLKDAREKYHLLLTGQAVRVVVDQNGERVEFTAASKSFLGEYINQLEIDLGVAKVSSRSPIGFFL